MLPLLFGQMSQGSYGVEQLICRSLQEQWAQWSCRVWLIIAIFKRSLGAAVTTQAIVRPHVSVAYILQLFILSSDTWPSFTYFPDIGSEIAYHSSLLLVMDQNQGCCTMYTRSCSEACLNIFGMTGWNSLRGESFFYAKWSRPRCSVVGTSQQESTNLSESSRSEASSIVSCFASCCITVSFSATWKSYNIALQMSSTTLLLYFVRSALSYSHSSLVQVNLRLAAVYMSSDMHGIRAKRCLWQWPSCAKDSLGHPSARNSQFVGIHHIVWWIAKGSWLRSHKLKSNQVSLLCWQGHYNSHGDTWGLDQIRVGASSFSPVGSWRVFVSAVCLFVLCDPAPII